MDLMEDLARESQSGEVLEFCTRDRSTFEPGFLCRYHSGADVYGF